MVDSNPFAVIDKRFRELTSKVDKLIEAQTNNSGIDIRKPATRQQVADFLDCSLPTVDKLDRSGQLKGFNIGRQRRFAWQEIDRFVNQRNGDHE